MTIIIEGPDNSGKTSLAHKLCKDLEIPYKHSVRRHYLSATGLIRHSQEQLLPRMEVQDRVYGISELVYGRVLRGVTEFPPHMTEILSQVYLTRNIIVYCRPSNEAILNNTRKQMDGVSENHLHLIEEYDSLFKEIKRFGQSKVIYFDYETFYYPILLSKCKAHLAALEDVIKSTLFYTKFRK
jgi:GTPase SAR1 family protein